ncbi:hypothetical protein GCM10022252_19690 [Streptosporangium oxazolinicum]|uniref:Minor tail protein n=1 Tax=Streptosporangium oxazolinicum TaxID=909287 RepID=A0ABP8ANU9_9ACTN
MLFKPTVVQLLGVDGQLYTLTEETSTGAAIMLRRGAKGLDAPRWDVKADEYPAIDGGFVRSARAGIREIFLPLTIAGTTRPEMVALRRRFVNSLNPARGLVTLQTTEYQIPDDLGDAATLDDMIAEPPRAISCFYAGGMEGGEGSEDGVHWARYGLILRCTSPYFFGLSRIRASFQVYDQLRAFMGDAPAADPFVSVDGATPGAGLQLSTNPIWADEISLFNPGGIGTQPRWEIRGPFNSRLRLLLLDDEGATLKELRFSDAFPVLTSEVLVIETVKGSQSIRVYPEVSPSGNYSPTAGKSVYWAFDTASSLWAIPPGTNRVALSIDKPTGMTPAQETAWRAANSPRAYVSYLPAYLGI